jgi:hypothetical protein
LRGIFLENLVVKMTIFFSSSSLLDFSQVTMREKDTELWLAESLNEFERANQSAAS